MLRRMLAFLTRRWSSPGGNGMMRLVLVQR